MKAQTNISVRIEYHEGKAMRDAWSYMMGVFENCSAPQPFPDGKEKGITIGDRCYVGYSKMLTSIFFVRNNMFFHVKAISVSDEVSILEIAKCIDREILNLSCKKEDPQNKLGASSEIGGSREK